MKITGITPSAMNRLMNYHWPGNIRELSHAIESTYNMMELECEIIEENHLPAYTHGESIKTAAPTRLSAPWSDEMTTNLAE